jgi:glycine/D-amino acid oxidase-like deaminating enzyme/nitrite reductase/ring-hydroxylating ferredoxin subunit
MTTSIWMSQRLPEFTAPLRDADVVIVGAGIAGLSIAYTLAERGTSVLVLDHGPGGGQTARTSAHLASALDDRYYRLRDHFGVEGARLAAASHTAAIAHIERLARGMDCGFQRVPGYLFAAGRGGHLELEREHEAAREAGLDVTIEAAAPLPFETGPALCFADQAEFHPLAYLRGLADRIVALGGRIHSHINVTEIISGDRPEVALATGAVVRARAVVDATGMGISSRFDIPIRTAAYRSYVLALGIPHREIPSALFWDTDDPYHYIRIASDEHGREVVLIGGADHRVGQGDPERAWQTLEAWARPRFPDAGEIVARWSGQISEPADGLALIGAMPDQPNVYIVTGDSGNGLTHGTIAGQLIPALIRGEDHPWTELYAPARTRRHGLGTLLHEAVSSNLPFKDWIAPADAGSIEDIEPGHGATVRRGVHLLAVYKDPEGTCHVSSARCPHLSGAVRWNDAEQAWECPVHGSRFDAHGHVLNGPCSTDLAPAP